MIDTDDHWNARYPEGWSINDPSEALESWRAMCRREEAETGRIVSFITKPFDPATVPHERVRAADHRFEVNGADWTGNGRLGGMGVRRWR